MISFSRFIRSFTHAWRGLGNIAATEQSFRIQLITGVCALIATLFFPLAFWQQILIFLLVIAVLVLEIINSILERLADAVHPRLHPVIKEVKDMMAAAVLLVSLTAGVVGFLFFWPHVWGLGCAILQTTFAAVCTSW